MGYTLKLMMLINYLSFHYKIENNSLSKLSYKLSLILYHLIARFLQLIAHNTLYIIKTLSRMERYFYNSFLKRNL